LPWLKNENGSIVDAAFARPFSATIDATHRGKVLHSRRGACASIAALLLVVGCRGGSVASDGYRGRLSTAVGESVEVAARSDRTRLTRVGGTHEIWTTIRRLDLGKQWDYRPFGPHANKVIVSKLRPMTRATYWESIPPAPGFRVREYADQFEGSARLRDHLAFGKHPCEVWDVAFFQGGVDRIWLATDLGSLPVRVQRGTLVPSDTPRAAAELRAVKDYQLVRIDAGAPLSLFELPEGAVLVPNPDDP